MVADEGRHCTVRRYRGRHFPGNRVCHTHMQELLQLSGHDSKEGGLRRRRCSFVQKIEVHDFLEGGRQFFRDGKCCCIPVRPRIAQCSPSTSSLLMMDSLVTAMYIHKNNKYSCHDSLAIVFTVTLSKHLIGLLPRG